MVGTRRTQSELETPGGWLHPIASESRGVVALRGRQNRKPVGRVMVGRCEMLLLKYLTHVGISGGARKWRDLSGAAGGHAHTLGEHAHGARPAATLRAAKECHTFRCICKSSSSTH
ncbi:hypothetical protein MRX96_019620 [Rhipicephalus microplus]